MSSYSAPLTDIDFALNAVVGLEEVCQLPGYQQLDPTTITDLLGEANRFVTEVVAPLNRIGDQQGSVLTPEGTVRTPDGFQTAYQQYVESGWGAVHLPPKFGGGGLPYTVGIVFQEMLKSANMAFSLCPLLTQAAIEALLAHGTPAQQEEFLGKLSTGEWSGTMCLSEPEAGSDVGALRTKAVRQSDGSYRLFGTKIFITWGDHDLAENIVHLVLARTPDSAPGTKGISMFIVPKFLEMGNGQGPVANDLSVVSLEHKLGIHASPTCVLAFGESGEGAVGWLIGEEQQGMKYMFTMMNTARIGVGIEGLSLGEAAFQQSLDYAQTRRQGRAVGAAPDRSSLISSHPDVRRNLFTIKSYTEAMRLLLYSVAKLVDISRQAEDLPTREKAAEKMALLTPVVKAWCTDLGVQLTSVGIQIHGGMGYIEETGAAQLWRDARIAPIYEGTNGIQAADLVTRKLPLRNGQVLQELLAEVHQTAEKLTHFPELGNSGVNLQEANQSLGDCSRQIGEWLLGGSYNHALAAASPYLEMLGTILGGWLMGKAGMVAVEGQKQGDGEQDFLAGKVATTRFYGEQLLPRAIGLAPAIQAGSDTFYQIEPETLAS